MGNRDAMQISLSGFAVVLLALAGISCGGTVIYVDADAPCGNGDFCWPDAYKYLQDALAEAASAQKPVEIRVAGGTYRPDESAAEPDGTGDRNATFQLISGVTIVGGYAGSGQADPNSRDLVAYETILSGDLEGNDLALAGWDWDSIDDFVRGVRGESRSENSLTVVTGSGTDETAVLDGFTIIGGNANCGGSAGAGDSGGGMYNESGNPTLINCTFRMNTAVGEDWVNCEGVSKDSGVKSSSECTYAPGTSGGGIHNSNSNPTLIDCRIIENIVFSGNVTCCGGGMANFDSNPVLTRCEFTGNVATGYDDEYYGGAMYNRTSRATLTDCLFISNASIYSSTGGVYNTCHSVPTLTGCRFEGNTAGAMLVEGDAILSDCDFIGNEGALSIGSYSKATVSNCTFTGNSGCVSISGNSDPVLANCTFVGNSAADSGGAICNRFGGNPIIAGCRFYGNTAVYSGGAVSNDRSNPTLVNCLFSGNRVTGTAAWSGGGGVYNNNRSDAVLINCTFSGNSAARGNAIGCWSHDLENPSVLGASNCIFRDGGGEIWNGDGSGIEITYSNTEGGWPGVGNVDADPLFEDADGPDEVVGTEDDDLQPAPGSPCIDAGDNSAVPLFAEKDVAGRVRIMDGVVDMGAHESQAHIYVDAATGDDLNDGLTPETALATIQTGIDIAADGYTVLVFPGVYTEIDGIEFWGKAITVRGIADAPILEAPGDHGASFFVYEGPDTVLENFVIRNCEYGVLAVTGAPTIRNVTFVGNEIGVRAYNGVQPDISNCIFWDNRDGDLVECSARYSWVQEEIERQPVEGLICQWKFDEGEGGTAYDSAGENHLRLLYPEWTSGQVGGALRFEGSDYAEVENLPGQQIYTDEITLSVWVKLNQEVGNAEARIVSKQLDEENSWALGVYGNGYLGSSGNQVVFHDSDGSSQWYDCMSGTDLSIDRWHHICVTDRGGSIRMYLNGALDESSNDGYGIPSDIPAGINIGRVDYGSYFNGSMDDIRIYNRALDAEEVADLHENGLWGYGSLADPLFADPEGGDYHLRSERGRYWAEHDLWVLDAVTSPCIDNGDPNDDASSERMPNGGRVNMGAYGGTAYASMSECWSQADYNCDGVVNMTDFAHLADRWLHRAEWIE